MIFGRRKCMAFIPSSVIRTFSIYQKQSFRAEAILAVNVESFQTKLQFMLEKLDTDLVIFTSFRSRLVAY